MKARLSEVFWVIFRLTIPDAIIMIYVSKIPVLEGFFYFLGRGFVVRQTLLANRSVHYSHIIGNNNGNPIYISSDRCDKVDCPKLPVSSLTPCNINLTFNDLSSCNLLKIHSSESNRQRSIMLSYFSSFPYTVLLNGHDYSHDQCIHVSSALCWRQGHNESA